MLNIDTRTADKKTTYSTFCRAIAIRAVHPHSVEVFKSSIFQNYNVGDAIKEKSFSFCVNKHVYEFVVKSNVDEIY
jgi:hypothetical protein